MNQSRTKRNAQPEPSVVEKGHDFLVIFLGLFEFHNWTSPSANKVFLCMQTIQFQSEQSVVAEYGFVSEVPVLGK